jgi:GTPase SAR1 family protein
MERDEYDDIYKSNVFLIPVIVVGDASVGKTNIIHCYSKGKVANNTMPTVGVEFASRIVPLKTSNG